jgi:DoxX-like family
MGTQGKVMTVAGWVFTGLVSLLMVFSGSMKLMNPPELAKQFVEKFGYPSDVALFIGIVELSCVAVYLIPPTAVLGAVLLTGYLGGATATHVRIHDSFIVPVIVGVFAWLGLFLRDPRVRALLPIRRSMKAVKPPAPEGLGAPGEL